MLNSALPLTRTFHFIHIFLTPALQLKITFLILFPVKSKGIWLETLIPLPQMSCDPLNVSMIFCFSFRFLVSTVEYKYNLIRKISIELFWQGTFNVVTCFWGGNYCGRQGNHWTFAYIFGRLSTKMCINAISKRTEIKLKAVYWITSSSTHQLFYACLQQQWCCSWVFAVSKGLVIIPFVQLHGSQ